MDSDHDHIEKLTRTVRDARVNLPQLLERERQRPGSNAPTPVFHFPTKIAQDTIDSIITDLSEKFVARQVNRQSWDTKTAKQARATFALFTRLMREERGISQVSELGQADLERAGRRRHYPR